MSQQPSVSSRFYSTTAQPVQLSSQGVPPMAVSNVTALITDSNDLSGGTLVAVLQPFDIPPPVAQNVPGSPDTSNSIVETSQTTEIKTPSPKEEQPVVSQTEPVHCLDSNAARDATIRAEYESKSSTDVDSSLCHQLAAPVKVMDQDIPPTMLPSAPASPIRTEESPRQQAPATTQPQVEQVSVVAESKKEVPVREEEPQYNIAS